MRIKIEVVNSVFNSYSSPFDRLSQRDFQNFANIGEQLFLLYDEGYITVGEIIDCYIESAIKGGWLISREEVMLWK